MRASIGTYLAATALASAALLGCSERQRDPNDNSSMAAGAPAVRAVTTMAAAPAEGLAGNSYVVEVREEGTDASHVDTLTFVDGRFRSANYDRMGFAAVNYREVRDNVGESFTATTTSSQNGSLEWTGTLAHGRLDGYATLKQGGQTRRMEFRGYPAGN